MAENVQSHYTNVQVLCGNCPDSECGKLLYFLSTATTAIECTNCGQEHMQEYMLNVKPVSDTGLAMRSLMQTILEKSRSSTKKGHNTVKVKGMSNYSCKLISPMLTIYGYDRETNKAKLLTDMNKGAYFDCSLLSDRAFLIDEKDLLVVGYGRDESGSSEYLKDTLGDLVKYNQNLESLVPVHADGDGHCLLHAVSRALVGRELFWHPLMTNLKAHFADRREAYKNLFRDFIEDSEWGDIIEEADPDFKPKHGEALGLRNIHVFGLANVLHRPIILLDSKDGMSSKGDYSGTFLPALMDPALCCDKNKEFNKPIVIAWSSKGRNHFVPVVGIKERGVPVFPKDLLPKPWGVPVDTLEKYVKFERNCCVIGGSKSLSSKYIQNLVNAMEDKFVEIYHVLPSIVADVHEDVLLHQHGTVGLSTDSVIRATQVMLQEERLFRCMGCSAMNEDSSPVPVDWLKPGGELYRIAVQAHINLKDQYLYKFPKHNNITCRYDRKKDRLLLIQDANSFQCKLCQGGSLRLVTGTGTILYQNGDKTSTVSHSGKCGCGYKHFWDGKEYDNLPTTVPVILEWNNRVEKDFVYWFQSEGDESLNSNAFELAQTVVQKHFPGEFGSERLVQKIVDQIFLFVLKDEPMPEQELSSMASMPIASNAKEDMQHAPSKIILTGEHSKSIHKEELTASKSEMIVQKKIEHGASMYQRRLSSSPKKSASKQPSLSNSPSKSSTVADANKLSMATPNGSLSKSAPGVIKEKKIRISAGNQGSEMFVMTENCTFTHLQAFIADKFDIPPDRQIIRAGFPPKRLVIPSEQDSQILPFSHGDKIMVEAMKPVHIEKRQNVPVHVSPANNASTGSADTMSSDQAQPSPLDSEHDMDAQFQAMLLNLIQGVDLWPWAQSQRSLFQPNGLFYTQAMRDLGSMTDGQHFSLPCFPKKVFAYSAKENEMLLCLGKHHIPVQEISSEVLELAHKQKSSSQVQQYAPIHDPDRTANQWLTETSLSRKDNVIAFSGEGHSLVDRPKVASSLENTTSSADVEVGAGDKPVTLSLSVSPNEASGLMFPEANDSVITLGKDIPNTIPQLSESDFAADESSALNESISDDNLAIQPERRVVDAPMTNPDCSTSDEIGESLETVLSAEPVTSALDHDPADCSRNVTESTRAVDTILTKNNNDDVSMEVASVSSTTFGDYDINAKDDDTLVGQTCQSRILVSDDGCATKDSEMTEIDEKHESRMDIESSVSSEQSLVTLRATEQRTEATLRATEQRTEATLRATEQHTEATVVGNAEREFQLS